MQSDMTTTTIITPTIITLETMHNTQDLLIDESVLDSLVSGYEAESDVGNEAGNGNESDEAGNGNESDESDESSDDELQFYLERKLAMVRAANQAKKQVKAQIKQLKLTNLETEKNVHTTSTDLLSVEVGLTAANATLEAANTTSKVAKVNLEAANARLDVVNLTAESRCKYLAETKQKIQMLQLDLDKAQQEGKDAEDAANKAKTDAKDAEIEASGMLSKYNEANAKAQKAVENASILRKKKDTIADTLAKVKEYNETISSNLKKAEGKLTSLKAHKDSESVSIESLDFHDHGNESFERSFADDDFVRSGDDLHNTMMSNGESNAESNGEGGSESETESNGETESETESEEKCSECNRSPTKSLINGKRVCNLCESEFKTCSVCNSLKKQKEWDEINGLKVCEQCKCPQCKFITGPNKYTQNGKDFCGASCHGLFLKDQREQAHRQKTKIAQTKLSTVKRQSKRKYSPKRTRNKSPDYKRYKETIRCPHCPHVVPHDRKNDLSEHIRTKHQKRKLSYTCFGCDFTFGDPKRFNVGCYTTPLEHKHGYELTKVHTLVPHFECPCCFAEYDKKAELLKHLDIHNWHGKKNIVLKTKLGTRGDKWNVTNPITFTTSPSARV